MGATISAWFGEGDSIENADDVRKLDFADACLSKASDSRDLGDNVASLGWLEQSLAVRAAVLGDSVNVTYNQPYVANVIAIGETHLSLRRFDRALVYFLRAKAVLEPLMVLKSTRHTTASMHYVNMTAGMSLVLTAVARNQHRQTLDLLEGDAPLQVAEQLLEQAVARVVGMDGTRAPLLVSLYHILARVYLMNNKRMSALRVIQRCLGLTLHIAQTKKVFSFLAYSRNVLDTIKQLTLVERVVIRLQQWWRDRALTRRKRAAAVGAGGGATVEVTFAASERVAPLPTRSNAVGGAAPIATPEQYTRQQQQARNLARGTVPAIVEDAIFGPPENDGDDDGVFVDGPIVISPLTSSRSRHHDHRPPEDVDLRAIRHAAAASPMRQQQPSQGTPHPFDADDAADDGATIQQMRRRQGQQQQQQQQQLERSQPPPAAAAVAVRSAAVAATADRAPQRQPPQLHDSGAASAASLARAAAILGTSIESNNISNHPLGGSRIGVNTRVAGAATATATTATTTTVDTAPAFGGMGRYAGDISSKDCLASMQNRFKKKRTKLGAADYDDD